MSLRRRGPSPKANRDTQNTQKVFESIRRLEKEVYIEELDAYRSSLTHGRVFEADIDGSHRFLCWEIR